MELPYLIGIAVVGGLLGVLPGGMSGMAETQRVISSTFDWVHSLWPAMINKSIG
jgi:hypothetical protein